MRHRFKRGQAITYTSKFGVKMTAVVVRLHRDGSITYRTTHEGGQPTRKSYTYRKYVTPLLRPRLVLVQQHH